MKTNKTYFVHKDYMEIQLGKAHTNQRLYFKIWETVCIYILKSFIWV